MSRTFLQKAQKEMNENQKTNNKIDFAFFGTDDFALKVLEGLKQENLLPKLVVTTEDKPKGRKLVLTPTPTKVWSIRNNIEYIEVKKLDDSFFEKFSISNPDLSIVASFGKIIPKRVLDLPKFGTINVHPSLLPKLRGPSPLQTAILNENETGVTIMKLDELVDHGPILAQEKLNIEWPPYEENLRDASAELGAKMLVEVIENILSNTQKEVEQNHDEATFTKKIEKIDGQIDLNDSPEKNLRKIRAFSTWPGTYFFDSENKRVIVKKAHIENNELKIDKVIPEGKKEMSYDDYLRGKRNS